MPQMNETSILYSFALISLSMTVVLSMKRMVFASSGSISGNMEKKNIFHFDLIC